MRIFCDELKSSAVFSAVDALILVAGLTIVIDSL